MAAENGNLDAISRLITMYFRGEGVEIDWRETMKWIMLATDCGDIKEVFIAADMAYNGYGVPKDPDKARDFYRTYALSAYYPYKKSTNAFLISKGLEKDYCRSVNQEAAHLNDFSIVSDMYEKQDKDALDESEFSRLVTHMAASDSPYRTLAAKIYLDGFIVAQDYAKALELFRKSYAQGDSEAAGYLAKMYHDGLGVGADEEKSSYYSDFAAMKLEYPTH